MKQEELVNYLLASIVAGNLHDQNAFMFVELYQNNIT